MNGVDAIIAYENGELGQDDTVALFQMLVDTGVAWQLQGRYGREAKALIKAGLVREPQKQATPAPGETLRKLNNPVRGIPISIVRHRGDGVPF